MPSLWSDQLMKLLIKPVSPGNILPSMAAAKDTTPQAQQPLIQTAVKQNANLIMISSDAFAQRENSHMENSSVLLPGKLVAPGNLDNQTSVRNTSEIVKSGPAHAADQRGQFQGQGNEDKLSVKTMNSESMASDFAVMEQASGTLPFQTSTLESHIVQVQQIDTSQVD